MKILQIIPAPEFMRGEYRRQDVYDEIYPIECRIACLALVEDDDGQMGRMRQKAKPHK